MKRPGRWVYGMTGGIVAQNKSGSPRPSQDDVDITRRLAFVLASIEVPLLDHYIFTDEDCFSFEEHGLMN